MEESRYQKLNDVNGSGYICDGCPVTVSEASVLLDGNTGKKVLSLTFENIGDRAVSGVYLKVVCYDRFGNRVPYGGKDQRYWSFPDLSLPEFVPDEEVFGGKTKLVSLDSDDIVDCDIFVVRAIYQDGSYVSFTEEDYVSRRRYIREQRKKEDLKEYRTTDDPKKRKRRLVIALILGAVLICLGVTLGIVFVRQVAIPGVIKWRIAELEEENRYADAVKYASENGLDSAVSGIVTRGAEYHIGLEEYGKAEELANLSPDRNASTTVFIRIAEDLSEKGRIDEAVAFADRSGLSGLITDIRTEAERYYTEAGDYEKALSFASSLGGDHSELYRLAAEKAEKDGEAEKALRYAFLGGAGEEYAPLYEKTVVSLSEKGKTDEAALLVAQSGRMITEKVTKELAVSLLEGASDEALRRNPTVFFPYISLERKICLLSEKIDAYTEAIRVLDSGRVAGNRNYLWSGAESVSISYDHAICVKKNGSVAAKGDNTYSQCDVALWRNIISASAGENFSVGLKEDGTVVACGLNTVGQCEVTELENIVSIDAGKDHTVALRSDGTVVAVGGNEFGQCDVSHFANIVSVSAGDGFTVGLRADGTLVASGDNTFGQCNVGEMKGVVSVRAGSCMTVCLLEDGSVKVIGGEEFGFDLSGFTDIVCIAAGKESILGLTREGKVIATGIGAPDVSPLNK